MCVFKTLCKCEHSGLVLGRCVLIINQDEENQMVVCKIQCPECGTEHEVPFERLDAASVLECNICGNEFSLNNEQPQQAVHSKSKSRKTQRGLKPAQSSARKRPTRRSPAARKSKDGVSTKYMINMCVGGLALILLLVVGIKLAKSNQTQSRQEAHNKEVNEAIKEINTTNTVKNEIAELKKELLKAQKPQTAAAGSGSKTDKAAPTSDELAKEENVVFESYQEAEPRVVAEDGVEDAPAFAKPPSDEEKEAPPMKKSSMKSKTEDSAPTTVVNNTADKNMILIESEQNELDELVKIPGFKLTDDEKYRMKELKNKYLWYKANRFKMTREEMDEAWDRRWNEILASNDMVKSRSDAMLPRPLQILLEGAKDQKERIYLMRIYQKPISFEEKELVRKARNQAIWERRKEEGPKRYPEDASKKRNQKYIDEYGYEYYLDDKGQRVYL